MRMKLSVSVLRRPGLTASDILRAFKALSPHVVSWGDTYSFILHPDAASLLSPEKAPYSPHDNPIACAGAPAPSTLSSPGAPWQVDEETRPR